MASRHSDPNAQVLAAYFAFALFGILVIFVGWIFLFGAAVVLAYRIYLAYRNSPARLTKIGHAKSLALHRQALELADQRSFPSAADFSDDLYADLVESADVPRPVTKVRMELLALAEILYSAEGLTPEDVPAPPVTADLMQDARYQDTVSSLVAKLSAPDALDLARTAIAESLVAFLRRLPHLALQDQTESYDRDLEPQFKIPLIDTCEDVGALVEEFALPFYAERLKKIGLFSALRAQLDQNLRTESGVGLEPVDPSKLTFPADHAGTAAEIVSAYLRYTPLADVFDTELPFNIDRRSRMEHWHLIAGSGHGKTQTLQHIIMGDLKSDDRPALIVVDSQGDMLRKIQQLAQFEDDDRLVIVDPEDDHSPALNMFDVKSTRLGTYARAVREQVEAGIIELFNYVFGALASELTAKQGTAFAYITRLMLAIPGATIHTFRELMETSDPNRFAADIAFLDPTSRAFFDNQFFNRSAFGETRQQIARRLYTVLQVPAFERMFASPVNKLDMFAAMQGRKVILINTSKALLKTDASALFGRYMIALTLNAAFERVAVAESERVPAYVIIDEAAEYFDGTLERLLAQARKFNLGVLFAHQHMDQLSPALRSAVAANTSIKMAGGVSDHDARLLAADMRTSVDFIGATRKRETSTEFACYVRNRIDAAVRLTVPFGTVEAAPKMTDAALAQILALNRARYALQTPPDAVTPNRSEPSSTSKPTARSGRRDPDNVDMRATEI